MVTLLGVLIFDSMHILRRILTHLSVFVRYMCVYECSICMTEKGIRYHNRLL